MTVEHAGRGGLSVEVLVALSTLKLGVHSRGARLFHDVLVPVLGSPGGVVPGDCVERLAELLGVGESARSAVAAHAFQQAVSGLAAARETGLVPVSVCDDQYPSLLRHIPDPPIVLWYRGLMHGLDRRPMVSIVGSRNASPEGLSVARRLARDLAHEGIGIVSGMARGIDGAAHLGAIDAAGFTIAVLGSGADVAYPRSHRRLWEAIGTSGVVLSEYLPGTPPLPQHFPLRNRIISGLSQATVVVEASERSGSLITARSALEQGRDVLAVPGAVASGCHRGCHALIKDGARLVETVDDIFEELGWARRKGPAQVPAGNPSHFNWLQAIMPAGLPCAPDDLSEKSGHPVAEILAELCVLELAGTVQRVTGGRFVRLD